MLPPFYSTYTYRFKPLHSGAFLLTGNMFALTVSAEHCFKPLHSGAFLLTLVRTINVTFFADGCPPCRTTNDLLPGTRW